MAEPARITKIAEQETAMFLAEQSAAFIECAINLAATTMELPALIQLLEEHAQILKEYG